MLYRLEIPSTGAYQLIFLLHIYIKLSNAAVLLSFHVFITKVLFVYKMEVYHFICTLLACRLEFCLVWYICLVEFLCVFQAGLAP